MADKTPSFQFYPADWLKDPALRSVSLEAKGAWIDLLCFMFNSEKRGFLVNASGPLSVNQIARYLGEPVRRTKRILSELDGAGVSATDDTGAIYSKRMVRDEHIRQVRRESGALGGNPDLVKQNSSKTEASGEQTAEQNPTPSSSSSTSVKTHTKSARAEPGVEGDVSPSPGGPPVDLPPNLPQTEDAARKTADLIGCPADFAAETWTLAASRGGTDAKGQPIRSWPHHLQFSWTARRSREAETASRRNGSKPESRSQQNLGPDRNAWASEWDEPA